MLPERFRSVVSAGEELPEELRGWLKGVLYAAALALVAA
jgi:hypothetical protein